MSALATKGAYFVVRDYGHTDNLGCRWKVVSRPFTLTEKAKSRGLTDDDVLRMATLHCDIEAENSDLKDKQFAVVQVVHTTRKVQE